MPFRVLKSLFAKDESSVVESSDTVDGLPVPSTQLIEWVTGQESLEVFLESGKLGVEAIEGVLERNGLSFKGMEAVLDFGCGCGRVLRYLQNFDTVRLHGTDINREAIAWADVNLNFAEFCSNRLVPPLRYRVASFDLVYAFSVFTHLPENLQSEWMAELRRVLRKGGHLIVSLHGDHYLPHVPEDQKPRYEEGGLVVRHSTKAGLNECAAFHPESYVRERLAGENGFEVVDFIPEGALGNPKQDLYLLKRV
ncbi:class I SAM-dependent methyltransferase [Pelagicoccus mobilis]|uniref:Class I SAM-dependent methyltransferase n=1 Tax=Pelagicoccus mobilis TaxID=415221 RepID=A0A934VQ46_9BACT|nr:class I SAM-dependent methyltransferase [Pelagicoccus mobilis]MBK1876188.1 class I SAM-dependent methyltransferase [Pelagicoccus mobilis]